MSVDQNQQLLQNHAPARYLTLNFIAKLFSAGYDVIELGIGSVLSGYFWINGANYCTHPDLDYVMGSIAIGVVITFRKKKRVSGDWCGLCLGCLILVINRLADLWNRSLQEQVGVRQSSSKDRERDLGPDR